MGRRGRAGHLPHWYKGKMVRCDVCGFEYGENEGKLFKQRGLWVDRACFDTLTDEDRENQIKK